MKPFIVKVISKSRSSNLEEVSRLNVHTGVTNESNLGLIHGKVDLTRNAVGHVSVFPEPVSEEVASARPSPVKSTGTSASNGAETPPNVKGSSGTRKGIGKLESAIQRLAQNALNNASSSTPSPTLEEDKEGKKGEYPGGEHNADGSDDFMNFETTDKEATLGQHKCDLCPFTGRSFRILKHHRRTHFLYRPYGCKYCALKSFYIANIRSHCELKHPGKPSTYLQFEKPMVLELNTKDRRLDPSLTGQAASSIQKTDVDNDDESMLSLPSRMLPPLSKEDLALAEQDGLLNTPPEDSSQQYNIPVGPVICPLCPHFLPSSLELRKHLSNSHPGYGPYKCGILLGHTEVQEKH